MALLDGSKGFAGGMDASREADDLPPSQVAKMVNCLIPDTGEKIRQRFGMAACKVDLPRNQSHQTVFLTGHVQAMGWYVNNGKPVQIAVIAGWIYELREIRKNHFRATVLNPADRNNATRTKAWVTTIPGGVIVQDGQSLPFYVRPSEVRRTRPLDGEIGVGKMGVYCQNRYFYTDEFGTSIFVSDFGVPVSLKEGVSANIRTIVAPEDTEQITAIGRIQAVNRDVNGGELVFSTQRNIYSVDVRGALEDWDEVQTGLGKARLFVPNVGATSPYSFESFNANLYYRTREFGIANLRDQQRNFQSTDYTISSSYEVDLWLANDTEWMLDQCYSVGYGGRLFTTVAPQLTPEGYVYWNGLVVLNPDPVYATRDRIPRRFEGLWTGIKPWALNKTIDPNGETALWSLARDSDGQNRFYRIDKNLDHDRDFEGRLIEIPSVIETRGFDFGKPFTPKQVVHRQYGVNGLTRDVTVCSSTRNEGYGPWENFDNRTFKVLSCCYTSTGGVRPKTLKPQSRKRVVINGEPSASALQPAEYAGRIFLSRQYRFDILGACDFGDLILEAEDKEREMVRQTTEIEETPTELAYVEPSDYAHTIT